MTGVARCGGCVGRRPWTLALESPTSRAISRRRAVGLGRNLTSAGFDASQDAGDGSDGLGLQWRHREGCRSGAGGDTRLRLLDHQAASRAASLLSQRWYMTTLRPLGSRAAVSHLWIAPWVTWQ